jgi:hypothetical protein
MLKGVWHYPQVVIKKENKGWNEPQKQSLNFSKWALVPRAVQKYEKKNRNNK